MALDSIKALLDSLPARATNWGDDDYEEFEPCEKQKCDDVPPLGETRDWASAADIVIANLGFAQLTRASAVCRDWRSEAKSRTEDSAARTIQRFWREQRAVNAALARDLANDSCHESLVS